jgi:large subunit ribosomal protein L35
MPKMKTHSGAKKRFKVTGSGKLKRLQSMRGHLFEKKSGQRMRRLAGEVNVSPADVREVKRLLGKK